MADRLATHSPAADGLLAAVASAEHLRRRRLMTRRLARLVPMVAGGLLLAAIVILATHSPATMFWLLAALATFGVGLFAWVAGRGPAVTGSALWKLDADANLGGELRSAYWFASQATGDAWTAYHLDGAALRVQAVSWPAVYPPVKATRAWAGSLVLGLSAAALILVGAWPSAGRFLLGGGRVAQAPGAADAAAAPAVSAELQKQIDELLRAVGKRAMPLDAARARISDLRDELSKLDPKAFAKAMAGQTRRPGDPDAPANADTAALAARTDQAAKDEDLPQDMKWSLQDLATKLGEASRPTSAPNGDKTAGGKNARADAASAAQAGKVPQEAGAQTRVTTADAQSSQMMASAAGPLGGEPQGRNGQVGRGNAAAAALNLGAALRKEAVDANADSTGANVLSEMRRKSEQSHSTLSFSHVAPLAAYGPSHALPPPPPPDALRPVVQQYFIRR